MKKSTRGNKDMKEVVRHISTMIMPLMLSLVMLGCGQGAGQGGSGTDTPSTPSGGVSQSFDDHADHKLIGGNISGLSGLLVLQNKSEHTLGALSNDENTLKTVFGHNYFHKTTYNGAFTFSESLDDGADYAVSVTTQPVGQECTVRNGTGIVSGADVMDIQIVCEFTSYPYVADPDPPVADPGPPVADPDPPVADPGPPVADPDPPVADPDPPVADPEPPVADPDPPVADPEPPVTDPEPPVEDPEPPVAITYTVGGILNGLSGTLELRNNSENDLAITSNGVFTFDASLEDGEGYEIAIVVQPDEQICTLYNGIGILAGADVTDVAVECGFNFGRVTISSSGSENFEHSYAPSVSDDGKLIVFDSESSNLVLNDFNSSSDIFVRDRGTGNTRRVSIAMDGTESNGSSYAADISGDGKYIAFVSYASNLVAGDNNNKADIFVHDVVSGEITLVSVASDGTWSNGNSGNPSISGNGRYVAFESASSNIAPSRTSRKNIYAHDRETGETVHVSMASDGTVGNKTSSNPSISSNGRYVAFESDARNLVEGDYNYSRDIFVRDLTTGETRRVSVATDGTEADMISMDPAISSDGRYISFVSYASNLVPDDLNYSSDIFVHDLTTGETRRVSVDSNGTEADFYSSSSAISSDGRYVAFESEAENLVSDDFNYSSDIFVHDLTTGETKRVSVAFDSTEGNGTSYALSISGNGKYVAFESEATNLVPDDFNNRIDIFVAPFRMEQ